ncbi:MAG TPA: hypothetical protein DIU07_01495 [Rhodobacteraceae bacterium]|nr:hypothetical protein [Paracoccaceae bacterium]
MSDHPLAVLSRLRRPKLLIRAARFGLDEYNRERDLRRLMRVPAVPAPRTAIPRLIEEEARLEDIRKCGGAAYSPARHVEVLIALMAEARLLPREERAA